MGLGTGGSPVCLRDVPGMFPARFQAWSPVLVRNAQTPSHFGCAYPIFPRSDTGRGHELDFAPEENAVKARFIEAGQGHVFNGFGDLNEAEK